MSKYRTYFVENVDFLKIRWYYCYVVQNRILSVAIVDFFGGIFMEQIQFQFMDNNKYIYKSNNLIESSYNLSLNEQRLIYLAVKKLKPIYVKSNIKPSQLQTFAGNKEFGDIRIYVNEFKKEFKLNGNSLYERLETIANNFFDNKIQYLNDDGTFVEKRWIITCGYNEKNKYISLTFHPDLILDLLVFKSKYGELQYDISKSFKTTYAFRIYELLKNYTYKGIRRIEINDLRHKLAIYDDKKYSTYSEFKRNILTPSINSINKNTDINIEFEEIRYGRSVGAIEFHINKAEKSNFHVENVEYFDQSHYHNIKNIINHEITAGEVDVITNSTIEAIREYKVDMTVYEYIKDKANIVNEYAKTNPINNYVGIIIKSIRENWTLSADEPLCEFYQNGNYTSNNRKRLKNNKIDGNRIKEVEEQENLLLGL